MKNSLKWNHEADNYALALGFTHKEAVNIFIKIEEITEASSKSSDNISNSIEKVMNEFTEQEIAILVGYAMCEIYRNKNSKVSEISKEIAKVMDDKKIISWREAYEEMKKSKKK